MSRLDNLNKILKNLQNESPGVEASALISEDGLMIASALPQDLDETRVAGMTATLLNLGTRATVELRRDDAGTVDVWIGTAPQRDRAGTQPGREPPEEPVETNPPRRAQGQAQQHHDADGQHHAGQRFLDHTVLRMP